MCKEPKLSISYKPNSLYTTTLSILQASFLETGSLVLNVSGGSLVVSSIFQAQTSPWTIIKVLKV